jgi:hypothetical protein
MNYGSIFTDGVLQLTVKIPQKKKKFFILRISVSVTDLLYTFLHSWVHSEQQQWG